MNYQNKTTMKVFRHNVENRNERLFNNTGNEKNPNAINFYATNLEYVEKYRTENSTINTYEVSEENLFDMNENFSTLKAYNTFIANEIGNQMRDYTRFMNEAKKVKERKMWAKSIEDLKNRESELILFLKTTEFQSLSDFDLQNVLIAELKEKGYRGYRTNNEIAIF